MSFRDVMIIVACVGVIIGSYGYANPEGATKVLEEDGYTHITITGRKFLGCDREFYRTTFTAKNSRGIPVSGMVCDGLFSGSVIKKD